MIKYQNILKKILLIWARGVFIFTGIVEEIGSVARPCVDRRGGVISIRASKILKGTSIGDSVAVNGACLTVRRLSEEQVEMDVMPETLRCTNLGLLKIGSRVNLERATRADSRMGGHILSGHIDKTAKIRNMYREGRTTWICIETGPDANVVTKGSIAIDGVSLTISRTEAEKVWVSLIPHTLEITTLSELKIGDHCNIEYDILSRYSMVTDKEKLTMNKLIESGF